MRTLRRFLFATAAAAALAACGRDPAAPVTAAGYTAATPVRGSVARAFYGDTLLAFQNDVFYWRDRVDWASQQAQVRGQVRQAFTHGALWRAADASIDPWLVNAPGGGLRDLHSAFFPPSIAPGVSDSPDSARYRVVGDTVPTRFAAGPARLAYVWFPNFAGRNSLGRADSTQALIRALDATAPCGWILDQRFNFGGDVAAMVSGLAPLLGDAPASATQPGLGGLLFNDNTRGVFFLQGGQMGIFDPGSNQRTLFPPRPTAPYTLRRPGAPVAILIGQATASAGELITFAFRGSPVPNRSFGDSTFGLTTGPVGTYLLPDSGFLNITASIMFDRTGRVYGGPLQPDVRVAGQSPRDLVDPAAILRNGDAVVVAAAQWLQAQPACAGAVASAGPLASRSPAAGPAPTGPAPTAAALPGEARPSRFVKRVSRYFLPGPRR